MLRAKAAALLTLSLLAGAAPAFADDARAPQRFLSPAHADGVNDAAVFGPAAAEVWVEDLRGREVFHARREGSGLIVWNGRDGGGSVVESGVYVAQIRRADGTMAYQSFAVAK